MGCILVYGEVSDSKVGYAKVYFPEQDVVSDWLEIVKPRAKGDDCNWPLVQGEQVACVMSFTEDDRCDTGVILGAISNDEDVPDADAGLNKYRLKFEDGGVLEYNKDSHKWRMASGGGEDLYTWFKDFVTCLKELTVNTATGPSSVPVNVSVPGPSGVTFTMLLTRLDNLLNS